MGEVAPREPTPARGAQAAPARDAEAAGELAAEAVTLARRWSAAATAAGSGPERRAARRLARLVADPAGLDLAIRFVDRVARPEDPRVAARELARLGATPAARSAPFLSPLDRLLLRAGGALAPRAPRVVVPLARRRLRSLVGHLVVDARDPALARHLAARRRPGVRLNVNLLGEAVLGEAEARRRAARTVALLGRGDVDYVSVKVSALVSQLSAWDTPGSVRRVVDALRPVLEAAARRTPPAFVTLDMEEYRDLDLTVESFVAALGERELLGLEAGIAVQAYLPDALRAFERLLGFARRRRARGGERIKIRLVKGANLAMERVEAEVHGWPPAPYASKAETDASFVRLLDAALRPEVTDAVRVGVASHNLYDVALAHLLARRRGVSEALDVEMLHGMAPAQARAVLADAGSLVLYTPVVAPEDFDVAVSYLVRRLEENAGGENFLHALVGASASMSEQEDRFLASVADLSRVSSEPRRAGLWREQAAGGVLPAPPGGAFDNVPDTDPASPANSSRVLRALAAPPVAPTAPLLTDPADVDRVVARAAQLAGRWAATPAAERAAVLRAAAALLEGRREELWTVMVHEGAKTIAEADPEVSEAVDLAAYYAGRADALDDVDGARFVPERVTVVTPPWNFPVAIPLGSALAALAAGSAVVLKPAPQTPACAQVAARAVREALAARGHPADLLQVVNADEAEAGRRLVTHPAVGTVLLTGSADTARLFARWRPDLRLLAETSGKNAIVVTPSADLDLAVADLVRSAFGHAGQKCSAASLCILVGPAARSPRLLRQLADAVSSLRVEWGEAPGSAMGALIEAPQGKLRRALTSLEPGESWLVAPRRLDTSGRLWSPGVKSGVRPGSFFHVTECFGPVLGLMAAPSLAAATRLQNATPFGLTGGLHSLDDREVEAWLAHVEVGNAYVNRHITGAVVRRQPFGGWKGSSVGPGAKAGGPNYVAQVGTWVPDGEPVQRAAPSPAVSARLAELAPLVGSGERAEEALVWLRVAAGSDAHVWATDYGVEHDPSALAAESNVLRYRPLPRVLVRAGEAATWTEVVRLALAAALTGTALSVSVDERLAAQAPPGATALLEAVIEDDATAVARLEAGLRVRVVGEAAPWRAAAIEAGATILTGPVLASGQRELLTMLREQTVSRTRHRLGHLPVGTAPPPP